MILSLIELLKVLGLLILVLLAAGVVIILLAVIGITIAYTIREVGKGGRK